MKIYRYSDIPQELVEDYALQVCLATPEGLLICFNKSDVKRLTKWLALRFTGYLYLWSIKNGVLDTGYELTKDTLDDTVNNLSKQDVK